MPPLANNLRRLGRSQFSLKLRHPRRVARGFEAFDDEAVNEGAERVKGETIDQAWNVGARSTGFDEFVRDPVLLDFGLGDEVADSSKGAFAAPSMTP